MGKIIEENRVYLDELNSATNNINNQKEEGFVIINELVEKTNENIESSKMIYDIIVRNICHLCFFFLAFN